MKIIKVEVLKDVLDNLEVKNLTLHELYSIFETYAEEIPLDPRENSKALNDLADFFASVVQSNVDQIAKYKASKEQTAKERF